MMWDSEHLWPAAAPRAAFLLLYQLLSIFIPICGPRWKQLHSIMRHFFLVVKKIINLVCVPPPPPIYITMATIHVSNMGSKMLHFASVLCSACWIVQRENGKKETTCRSGSVWGGADGWAHPSLCAAHPSRLRKPLFLSWSSRLHSNPSPWSLISRVSMRDNVIFIAVCSAACFAGAVNDYSSSAVQKTAGALAASPSR